MRERLKQYFLEKKIEYFSVLDYADCIEINKSILDRSGITPRSIIMYLIPYYTVETINLSRYAASLDYHLIIKEINDGLISLIQSEFPSANVKGYGDHSPINERHAALIAGLGILGDNGLIINEKYGSYVFAADVITDLSPDLLGAVPPCEILHCSHCGACKRACPTGILRGEGEDCLSAITQRKGDITEEEQNLMREYNTLWGCDLCQTSCMYNANPMQTPVDFFYRDPIQNLTRDILDSMSDEQFSSRAFAWRKRQTISRNIDILAKK